MRDMIGGKITKDDLLYWRFPENLHGVLVNVAKVEEGGLTVIDKGKGGITPPTLTVFLTIPVAVSEPGKEPWLSDFLRVVNPRSDQLVQNILDA
jgi:hypothetical protein